jgi:hypothetical protein
MYKMNDIVVYKGSEAKVIGLTEKQVLVRILGSQDTKRVAPQSLMMVECHADKVKDAEARAQAIDFANRLKNTAWTIANALRSNTSIPMDIAEVLAEEINGCAAGLAEYMVESAV